MALQSSGAISLNDIAGEFGGSVPHALSEYYKGGTLVLDSSDNINVPTSGLISLGDFYGASASAGPVDYLLDWSSTYSPGSSTAGPINVYYRRSVVSWHFTADELVAAGMSTGAVISEVTFYVTNRVESTRSINDWQLGMVNMGSSTTVGSVTQVYSKAGDFTDAESLGDMTLVLASPFTWTGGNLGFKCAWAQNDGGWISQGAVRSNSSVGFWFSRTDSAGSYTLLDNPTYQYTYGRPSMKLKATAGVQTEIGFVVIEGPSPVYTGETYGPYTWTASITGDAANPTYSWSVSSGGYLVSQSGNQGVFRFTSPGTNSVTVTVSDFGASDSPQSDTDSFTTSQGNLYIGTPTVEGQTEPFGGTEETYTLANITDSVGLETSLTYSWSVVATGSTSGSLSFTGQGTTSITVTYPTAGGTYNLSCDISSTDASDSPKTASLQVAVLDSSVVVTSPTLGSHVNGGWTSVGDGVGQVNIDRNAFVIGRVYDVTITTGPTAWHSSAGNFRDSVRHGMGISDNHNNIANGPNQSRLKRIVLRGDVSSNYYYYFVSATDVSDYYGIELHAWVDGTSSTAGYIFRRFYDVTSLDTRNGNNPSITTYSGSQTFDSSSFELGTTINVTINRAAGGWSTNYLGQAINFTAATTGWVQLNAIFRKGTGNWTASSDYFYFKVMEIQSNGNADTEMIHSIISNPSDSTSQYVASQWVHFDQGRNYRIYPYFSNRFSTAASTWGPHYIDLRSGDPSTGPLWHTYTCQVNVT